MERAALSRSAVSSTTTGGLPGPATIARFQRHDLLIDNKLPNAPQIVLHRLHKIVPLGAVLRNLVQHLTNDFVSPVPGTGACVIVVSNLALPKTSGGREAWYANAASSFFSAQQYPESLRMSELSIRQNPNYADGWVNFGAALHATGKVGQARQAWNRALQLKPDQFEALRDLAVSYEKENPQLSRSYWERANQIKDKNK